MSRTRFGPLSRRATASPFWIRLRLRLFLLASSVLARALLVGTSIEAQDPDARLRESPSGADF